ncbi:MAG: NAD(P)H:quinone oxidoreductase, type IV [Pusillimonas sp.]|nr:MAG: NAD(P)H:quinone oxidoreductase, type IV [Pusillimonas sp.]
MTVNLAIVYYSTYGTNFNTAVIAAEATRKMDDVELRLLKVKETAPLDIIVNQPAWKAQSDRTSDIPNATIEDMEWANAYLIIAPTRYGVQASQMRSFIDTLGPLWAKGGLANKAVSAMTSAKNTHGGQESTLLSFYTTAMHWGAIVVSPGYTDPSIYASGGNPYGYSHTQGADFDEVARAAIQHQTTRLVSVARKLL